MAEIDTDLLLRVLKEEEDDSTSYYSSELARAQSEAMDRYHAKPYGDSSEVPNRSQVVTHDIEDTINWVMPHLVRVMSAGDDLISCEDDGLDDDSDTLDTAAKYLTHVFFKDNPGETILHDFIFDGLLQKIGIVRAYWEDPKPSPPKTLQGLPLELVAKYISDPRYEILAAQIDGEIEGDALPALAAPQPQVMPGMPGGPGLMGGMGQPPIPLQPSPEQFQTATITVRKINSVGRARARGVPPEEFRVSRRARSLEEADYHGWKHQTFLADVIQDHPDKEVELDPDFASNSTSMDEMDAESDERVVARFPHEPSTTARNHRNDIQRRKVWLNIEYVRGDFDGDGTIELRRVKRVDNVILENDIVEETEFVVWSPIRVSHRLIGRSIADTLLDIQKIRTVLTRKAMDSLTQSLAPRTFFNKNATGGDDTVLDRILDHEVGDVIPVDGNPRDILYTEVTPDVSGSAFQAIEYWDRRSEEASGVNRHAMGIQPQAITQTKGGIDMLQAAANSRVEQVARWAASGFEQILAKLLRLIIENQDQPRIIKVAGKPLRADPRLWSDDMTVSVHVGMAAESREKKLAYLGSIAGKQETIMQVGGFSNPIVTPKHYRATLAQMVSVMGYKNPAQFFAEIPDDWQPPEQGEDPKTTEVKQKGEIAKAELQSKQQIAQAELQSKTAMAEADAQRQAQAKAMEFERETQLQQAKMQTESQLQQMEMAHKQQLAEMQAKLASEQAAEKARFDHALAQMKAQNEMSIARERIAAESAISAERLNAEMELARWKASQEIKLARYKGNGSRKIANDDASVGGDVRFGGNIG